MRRDLQLEATVGIVGAVIMILELTASRVLAPAIGSSLVAWTAIIGTIMATLAVGYELGGRLADRQKVGVLEWLLFISAVTLAPIGFLAPLLLPELQQGISDIRLRSISAALILFGMPTITLGAVLSYATGLALRSLSGAGTTVARMYVSSTIGSIVGTFIAGFFLIATMGNAGILFLLATVLMLLSCLWAIAVRSSFIVLCLLCSMLALIAFIMRGSPITRWPASIADIDTMYNRYIIRDLTETKTGRPVRYLQTSPFGSQSSMFLDADDDLVAPYLKFFRLAHHFNPDITHALMIGGGGFSFPKDYLRQNPDKTMDIVEMDGQLVDIGEKYFHLKKDDRMRIYESDARLFVQSTSNRYDVVFIDAFDSQYSIPFHLTTVQWVQSLKHILTENGIVVLNIVSSLEGVQSAFFHAQSATYAHVFPSVYAFAVSNPIQPEKIQNIVLIAQKSGKQTSLVSDDPQIGQYLSHRYLHPIKSTDGLLLTDDFAPIEQMTSSFYKLSQ